ncbi:hypothetical protein Curi_c01890 [Gottschalkia acidurici 9a]|uniref:Uncharacterized protein n=1 Tax=Gottschalkia acidurici (strain ATCC 7906 / DSM 604 / BCRC 14475 / CIP 104303 / KCTC 5404 / NCIMB 10678 / 9a) TaxID=1128398 RepID=K0AVG0_GOTA9|nr:hypothetical protein [Gottschalkia acidurici]AFS77269.1 hypothetical protein Curi_c01890 [Gottschalkia acidurici 9a]
MENEILRILKDMQKDLSRLKEDISSIKATQEEHTQLLRILEHKTDVVKAEQDKTNVNLAHIEGEIGGIRSDISKVEIITAKNWSDIATLKLTK